MKLLESVGFEKSYGRRKVVDGINIDVFAGEVVGLLGPNGAGKTTSFRMIMGMIRGDGGKVFFSSTDITAYPMYRRARIGMGYLSQEPSVFQRLTARENLLAILETLKLPRRERMSECERILAEMELTRIADSKASTLSGGEKRRLEIARALITKPSLLLLDEPFSGVDPKSVYEIQGIIMNLKRRGIGILLTDHSVRETLAITDRAYIIHDGRVLVSGTADKLITDEQVRKVYLGETFQADGINYVEGGQEAGRMTQAEVQPRRSQKVTGVGDIEYLVDSAIRATFDERVRRDMESRQDSGPESNG